MTDNKVMFDKFAQLYKANPGSELKEYSLSCDLKNFHVVLYHAGCADGIGAAWAFHKSHDKYVEPDTVALYIPVSYNDRDDIVSELAEMLPPESVTLHILDFSFLPEQFDFLSSIAKQVVYLDHHAGAEEDVAHAKYICENGLIPHTVKFDNDHSGCYLAWEHYHRKQSMMYLILHIEDRDLWRFKLENTKPVMAAVHSYPMTLHAWDHLPDISTLATEGKAILRAQDKQVQQLITDGSVVFSDFHGHITASINCPYFLVSEACHALLEKYDHIDIAVGWQSGAVGGLLGALKYSFRARKGGVYLPKLLAPYGGGGHQAAAGVTFKYPENATEFLRAFS
jgi:hypothetical protein